MDLLARRDHSHLELRTKLQSKGFELDVIDEALCKAQENGWMLPPEELAERLKAQLDRKLKGARYIGRALEIKGLPCPDFSTSSERDKIFRLIQKRIPAGSVELSNQQRASLQRFLLQRGFEMDDIHACLQDLKVDSLRR